MQSVADNDVTTMGFFNSEGKLVANLGAHSKGGVILLQSPDGMSTVAAGFYTQGDPGIFIKDAKGTVRASLYAGPSGQGLVFRDEAGTITAPNAGTAAVPNAVPSKVLP